MLMDGQAKLIEMGTQSDGNWRNQQARTHEGQNLGWTGRRENEQQHSPREGNSHGGSNWRMRRLNLPSFDGEDTDD